MTPFVQATEYVQTSLPLMPPSPAAKPMGTSNRLRGTDRAFPTPRMIKSVVDEAGLGKFVYLQGSSGRRYVFSSIRREQASLYDHALFAATSCLETGGQSVEITASINDISNRGGTIYVHLLDDEDSQGAQTLEDLCTVN
ncbi:MAG: hypothetical protein GKR97_00670 [Rhizobiaceae bacterium]|nr:hypothetical protein [Rhizobiaceae bacterium]